MTSTSICFPTSNAVALSRMNYYLLPDLPYSAYESYLEKEWA
jgi:hypothetical protein